MLVCPAWKTRLVTLATAIALSSASNAVASVHVTYNVGELSSAQSGDSNFSASWLHDASMGLVTDNGSTENGAYRTGRISDLVSGSIEGDLEGNVLSEIRGSVGGKLSSLHSEFGSFTSMDQFVVRLGQDAGSGRTGALKFETNGVGTGQFSGGFIDFALDVGSSLDLVTGTFFFKPQSETGSSALSPNRGNSTTFTLWGFNWMHDSDPVGSDAIPPDWLTFLGDLGYDRGEVLRQAPSGGEMLLAQTLGIALYVNDPDPPLAYAANPEPSTFLVWGVLAMIGVGYGRRNR